MTDTHIKIPDVSPVVRYAANGTQTVFSYPFPVFASEDVAVYLNGALQVSGYAVTGAGVSEGGTVTFAIAPANGVAVTIERRVPYERMTDFLEGGALSAASLNNELDYLAASIQQLARDQGEMLRFDGLEAPSPVVLPARASRANRALAFDENGDMTTVQTGSTLSAPTYVQTGTGATSRNVTDKVKERVSVKDFGAVGNGIADDTTAFINALAAHTAVFVPAGTYRVTSTIVLGANQSLVGVGQGSVIAASTDTFHAIEMRAGYATLSNLKITGGNAGVKLYGHTAPCVQNTIHDVVFAGCKVGLYLDGYNDTAKPCYWNQISNVLVLSPTSYGVRLTKAGAGDTPNANRFHNLRVYSQGVAITGSGIYVEFGGNANLFTDCEVNVDGTALACVRVGAGANKTHFVNLYTESFNTVPNVRLDAGSLDTAIYNLHAQSNGSAIYDLSGGQYTAVNAGYPYKYTLGKTTVSDINVTLLRHDTVFVDAPSAATIDVTAARTVHLVAATNGQITMRLPAASAATGAVYTIKKVDSSANLVIVTVASGTAPDGRDLYLGGPNDYVSVMSNGAQWYILSSNRMAGNTRFHDGAGTYDIDMAVDTYLMSAFAGVKTVRLPPANAANAIGRMVHIKKTDVSGNAVNVTVQGGGNIDGSASVALSAQYQSLSAVSNGAQWYIINRYP
ncbi:MAG: hypothetical protein KGQ41_01680 [Alphaproteobacteria bacterium]|nr:hypothetical protein [Alphaproteobacteria bacterium]